MLQKIYHELVKIRKELQAIRSCLEPKNVVFTLDEGPIVHQENRG